MSTLVTYRKAVEDRVRELLPAGPDGVRTVTTHIGEFGPREVEEYAASSPAVILAPLGFPKVEQMGRVPNTTISYGAFILTKSMANDGRGDIALAIMEVLMEALPFETWGTETCASVPTDIDAGNLYTGKVDDMGVALWVIRWDQKLQLIPGTAGGNLADFLRLDATYNLDPGNDDPDDFDAPQTIELEGPDNE